VAAAVCGCCRCNKDDPEVQETFRNEVFLMKNLHHINLIRFYGACIDPPSILTELMLGNLASLLYGAGQANGAGARHELGDRRQLAIAYGIANGLAVLHTHGVCHRDLKSPNVLYDRELHIKLCDFAFSKFKQQCGDGGTVQMDSRVGTPAWMAPEVLRGEAYSKSADLYSYGVILWEVCCCLPCQPCHACISWCHFMEPLCTPPRRRQRAQRLVSLRHSIPAPTTS
jgi:serine/threonine protein kinase